MKLQLKPGVRLLAACLSATAGCVPKIHVPAEGTVLSNVTIVNPGVGRRSSQTIVVRDGRIESISETPPHDRTAAPALYALPGLIDMHVHHPIDSGIAAVSGDARLFDQLFLSHGVTAVRDTGSMDGSIFPIRRSIRSGSQPGPRIFACGAIIDGEPPGWPRARVVHNADEARKAADDQADAGADCIKVYDNVSSEALAAIEDEALKRHLPVIGHLPRAVPFEQAHLADVQHLTGVAQIPKGDPIGGLVKAWRDLPAERIDFVVRVSVEQGIQHTPTMTVPKNLFRLLSSLHQPDYHSSILMSFPEAGSLPRYYRDALWKPGFLIPADVPAVVTDNAPRALRNLDLKVFDQLLAYDFNTFVGGHLTQPGTRKDVEDTKEFTFDVYRTVKRIHNNMDQNAVAAEAAKTVGLDNKFLIFKAILDRVTEQSMKELRPRWINRLAGVDVWLESQVNAARIYVRWDDKN